MQTNNSQEYLIAIGGNIGDVEKRFFDALRLIEEKIGKVKNFSRIFLSKPLPTINNISQSQYLNAVMILKSVFSPRVVLKTLIEIEEKLGRNRNVSVHWGPRTIDLDIVACSNLVIDEEDLKIPHPRMIDRDFVLLPLKEIYPNWKCPRSGKLIDEIIRELPEDSLLIEKVIDETHNFNEYRNNN